MFSLSNNNQADIVQAFISTSRYLDEVHTIDTCNSYFKQMVKVSKGANIRNRYNQVPHLNQDTKGKVTNPQ